MDKLFKVEITDWSGRQNAELHIPEDCNDEFKRDIIGFLCELDDHDGMDKCREIWKLTDDDWEDFCRSL